MLLRSWSSSSTWKGSFGGVNTQLHTFVGCTVEVLHSPFVGPTTPRVELVPPIVKMPCCNMLQPSLPAVRSPSRWVQVPLERAVE